MLMYVDAEAPNLRSEPEISPQTKLGILHLWQPVDMLGQTATPGWVRVSAELDGRSQEGWSAASSCARRPRMHARP